MSSGGIIAADYTDYADSDQKCRLIAPNPRNPRLILPKVLEVFTIRSITDVSLIPKDLGIGRALFRHRASEQFTAALLRGCREVWVKLAAQSLQTKLLMKYEPYVKSDLLQVVLQLLSVCQLLSCLSEF